MLILPVYYIITVEAQNAEMIIVYVEKAGLGDIDALVEMRLSFLLEDNGVLNEELRDKIKSGLPGYFRTHLNRDLFVYVIREAQSIVSCAFLLITEKPMNPAFPNGLTGTVLNVYTCQQFRNRGYAGMIMREMIAEAEKKDVSVIELQATEYGYSLYRAVGFRDDHSRYYRMKWENPKNRID